jgi:hypothetical protein
MNRISVEIPTPFALGALWPAALIGSGYMVRGYSSWENLDKIRER